MSCFIITVAAVAACILLLATIVGMCGEVGRGGVWRGGQWGGCRLGGIVGIGAGKVGISDWLGLAWDHILYARDLFYCDFRLPMAISMADLSLNKK